MAAAVCAIQALLLAAAAATYVMEIVQGRAADPSLATMSMLVTLIFAGLLALLAMRWWGGYRWPRTPTMVWSALLLPVAYTLAQANGWLIGLTVVVISLTGLVSAALSPSPDLPDEGPSA